MVCCTCWVVHSVWYLVVHTVRLPLRHFWVTVGEAGNLGSGRTSSTILFSFSSEFCGTWKGELATLIFPSGQMRTLTWKIWHSYQNRSKLKWGQPLTLHIIRFSTTLFVKLGRKTRYLVEKWQNSIGITIVKFFFFSASTNDFILNDFVTTTR